MNDDAAATILATISPEGLRLIHIWAESLAQVLGQISGSPFPCTVLTEASAEFPPAGADDLWILCACSGGLRGEMSLRLPPASVVRLARLFMGETTPVPAAPSAESGEAPSPSATAQAEPSAEEKEAATELVRQVAGRVASALKAQWGETQLRPEAAAGAPSWPSSATAWLRAGDSPDRPAWLQAHLSAALAAALRVEKPATASAASPPAPSSKSISAPPAGAAGDSRVQLDLLLDVELALTLRFGSRSLPLGEILDLTPGAVIELDRQVQDPVDVLLDGRLVARGEVVVMDGNYGLRVTEVGPGAGS
jgi:flagellar motor switch protein FliN